MDEGHLERTLKKRLAWVGAASSAVALLDIFALILILKFWVDVDVYGIATVVVTLFGALELAAELGLSAAVIQRDQHSEDQLSTLFWWNVIFGIAVYAAVFAAAPWMARLHGEPIIEDLFKVFGLNLLLRSIYSIYQAQLKKQLRFRELSLVRIVANVADFVAKVVAAAAGLGVWCFVVGHLARSAVFCIGLPLCHRWRPRFVFKAAESKADLLFGARSAASEFLFQLYSNLDYQVVNFFFGPAALGYYRAAYELVLEPIRFLSGVVVAVAFPVFSRMKANLPAVRKFYIAFTKQNLVAVLTLIALIVLTAEDLLSLFFRAEYASAAGAARVLAMVGLFRALSYLGPPLLEGLGRPDLTLRYQATATLLLCGSFVLFARVLGGELGYVSVALAWAAGYPLAFAVLTGLALRTSKLTVASYLRPLGPIAASIALAAIVALAVRLLTSGTGPALRLALVAAVLVVASVALLGTLGGVDLRKLVKVDRDPDQVPPP